MVARKSTPDDTNPASATQVGVQPAPYTAHHDHSFTLQMIMELHKAAGGIDATLKANTAAIGKLDERINKIEEKLDERIGKVEEKLSGVTHKIYAAGVVLAILVAIGGFIVDKAWDITVAQLAIVSQKDK